MNPPRKTSPTLIKIAILLSLVFLALFSINSLLIPSVAQSNEERELEDKIPKHLPIKVKIKKEKEKAFKDLKNEKWLRDFELEVTNTSDKPIYYLSFTIELPEVKGPYGVIGYPLRYGRHELMDFRNRATPEDVAIQPGETYVFKVPENMVKGWELFNSKHDKPIPKKVEIRFHILHFGDGTGFGTTEGLPVTKKQDSKISSEERKKVNGYIATINAGRQRPPDSLLRLSLSLLPANLLPVKFSLANTSNSITSGTPPQAGLCCPGTSCSNQREGFQKAINASAV